MIKELIVQNDPKSPISEIFRTLRTNIQFMNNKGKLKSILITSTLSGEGKSWTSSNLAVTFAQAGKKVILLDADMRKGRQYKIFDLVPIPGLSDYLAESNEDDGTDLTEYIQRTEVENLYVIPAGNIPPNPSELLVSENMLELLEKLKEICDIIIVDGPPTQLVTDSLILTRIVDSTVIVAESNHTKKENLHRMIDNIQKVGGKIAGVVINKVQISANKYEQTYYYGASDSLKSGKTSKYSEEKEEIRKNNKEKMKEILNQSIEEEELENNQTSNLESNLESDSQGSIENNNMENVKEYFKEKETNELNKLIEENLEDNEENIKDDVEDENDIEEIIIEEPIDDIERRTEKKIEKILKDIDDDNNTEQISDEEKINTKELLTETKTEEETSKVEDFHNEWHERTQDIIKRLNEYVETEKKKLNNNE